MNPVIRRMRYEGRNRVDLPPHDQPNHNRPFCASAQNTELDCLGRSGFDARRARSATRKEATLTGQHSRSMKVRRQKAGFRSLLERGIADKRRLYAGKNAYLGNAHRPQLRQAFDSYEKNSI